jgi:hypothetical protein
MPYGAPGSCRWRCALPCKFRLWTSGLWKRACNQSSSWIISSLFAILYRHCHALMTHSMPWLQNQSLTRNGAANKRLARRRFGPHLDPMRASMRVWTSKGPAFERHGCGRTSRGCPHAIAHARGRIRLPTCSCRTKKRVSLYSGRRREDRLHRGEDRSAAKYSEIPTSALAKSYPLC